MCHLKKGNVEINGFPSTTITLLRIRLRLMFCKRMLKFISFERSRNNQLNFWMYLLVRQAYAARNLAKRMTYLTIRALISFWRCAIIYSCFCLSWKRGHHFGPCCLMLRKLFLSQRYSGLYLKIYIDR